VAHLTGAPGGDNGTTVLAGGANGTAGNDMLKDTLTGSLGLDWFVLSSGDTPDRQGPEQALTV
jgi:hypothetical protein